MSGASATPRMAAFAAPSRAIRVRPAAALQWAVLLLVISQVGRIPLLSTGDREAPLLINELVLAALFTVGIIAAISARSFRLDRVALVALIFAMEGGISSMMMYGRMGLSMRELVVSLAYLVRWVFYLGVYIYIINTVKGRDVRGIWEAMEKMLLIFAAFGIVQSIFLPNFAFILYPESRPFLDFDPQGHRLVSTILEPNVAGMILVVGLLVHLACLAFGEKVAHWKMLLLFVALVLTISRSAVIALLVGATVIVLVRGFTKRILRITAAVVTIILLALPQLIAVARLYNRFDLSSGSSAAARYQAWLRAIDFFVQFPVMGIGFNTFAPMVNRLTLAEAAGVGRASSEGGLLFVATLTGVVGLAIFTWMLALIIRRCRFIWRHPAADPFSRSIAVGTAGMVIALCVDSVFVNTLFATFTMELMWVLAGLCFVIARELGPASGRVDVAHA
jgi:hypothetical protein